MKLIINTTNLRMGGALQVAYSLLNEFRKYDSHEYHVMLSRQLSAIIKDFSFPPNFYFYHFNQSPTQNLLSAIKVGRKLSALEQKIAPDIVFTVFGPAIWKPRTPHLLGFANVVLFDKAPYTKRLLLSSLVSRIKYFARRKLTLYEMEREGDVFWLETELAKKKLTASTGISPEKITVITNNYGDPFENAAKLPQVSKAPFSFIYITTYYPHKNLEILNRLIPILKQRKINCVFHLTLRKEDFERTFPTLLNDNMLQNHGPQKPVDCPKLYTEANALFCPTFLEFFSAAYPEAMVMERPIITSDMDFAHDICGDAALYFDPFDPESAADTIEKLISDPNLSQKLVANGKKRLESFDTAAQRAEKLLNVMKDYLVRSR